MLRVLHIIEGLDKELGGLPYALTSIINVEQHIGVKSEILSIKDKSLNIDSNTFADSILNLYSSSFPKRFNRSIEAVKWLKSNILRFDLIIYHGVWTVLNIETSYIANKNNIPYVIWPHGSLDNFDLQKKRYLKRILGTVFIRNFLKKAQVICCTSPIEIQNNNMFGAASNQVVLPLVIENEIKNFMKDSIRKIYNISSDKVVFLFLSRINYKKGLDKLIIAISQLEDFEKSKIVLLIAGNTQNSYADYILNLVSETKTSDIIKFVGQLSGDKKFEIMSGADVFVLPSQNENFGIAIVEALSCGLPVLITKNVYIQEDIMKHDAGWICDYSSISIKTNIQRIISSKSYIKKGSHAKNAADEFNISNNVNKYSDFYGKFKKNSF